MRRIALLAAYTAIALFRPGPASGADSVTMSKSHSNNLDRVACGGGKMLPPRDLKIQTCK